ncbi:uncharacterized protein LOC141856133 [Brevipalpus obovatus]|uniref:uncharacterized protein LOC141856133 n=1 Tax=Brevipalpus obovatus TaxID=246614 RepID=UPI003D9E1BB4
MKFFILLLNISIVIFLVSAGTQTESASQSITSPAVPILHKVRSAAKDWLTKLLVRLDKSLKESPIDLRGFLDEFPSVLYNVKYYKYQNLVGLFKNRGLTPENIFEIASKVVGRNGETESSTRTGNQSD